MTELGLCFGRELWNVDLPFLQALRSFPFLLGNLFPFRGPLGLSPFLFACKLGNVIFPCRNVKGLYQAPLFVRSSFFPFFESVVLTRKVLLCDKF